MRVLRSHTHHTLSYNVLFRSPKFQAHGVDAVYGVSLSKHILSSAMVCAPMCQRSLTNLLPYTHAHTHAQTHTYTPTYAHIRTPF